MQLHHHDLGVVNDTLGRAHSGIAPETPLALRDRLNHWFAERPDDAEKVAALLSGSVAVTATYLLRERLPELLLQIFVLFSNVAFTPWLAHAIQSLLL